MDSPSEQGNPNAPVLFLCEAPAAHEMRTGKPLAGMAGDVFNECLHAAGLIRHDSYILNLWPFQVQKDDKLKTVFMKDRPGIILYDKKGFTPEGWEAAQPALEKAKASGANIVVTMGVYAAHAALDKRSLMKWRGSPLWSDRLGKKMIPTVHPAATLYGMYLWRYLIISDLTKARRMKDTPKLILPDRKFHLDPSFDDVMDYMKMVYNMDKVASDLEAINHQVSCFCLAPNWNEAMVIPMADEVGEPWWDELSEMRIWQGYAKIMGNPNLMKVNQNLVGFDQVFLTMQNNTFTYGPIGDCMIAHKIMYPDFRKGLDMICSTYTDEPYYKDEGKMWKGMGGTIEEFWVYNGKDGCVALEAWDKLADEMTDKGYWPTYERVVRRARFLAYMSIRGMKVDHEALVKTHGEVSAKLKEKEAELVAVSKYPFNPSSPQQCQLYFYGTLGYAPYTKSGGGVTTDDKAMARLYRKYGCKEAKLVQEVRALRKLKSTYLEVGFDSDGRLRCSWDPTGTIFGRLSSSQTIFGTGMNQQNLHPEFKHFLVADEEPLI